MSARRRVLISAILHETNTFNRTFTRLIDFEGRYRVHGLEAAMRRLSGTATEMGGFLEAGAVHGWDMHVAVAGSCGPSGPLRAADWSELKQALLGAEGHFDGILLALHGAMVTEDSHDPEGDLLTALRLRHGPRMPIIATLDMHANVSEAMVCAVDAFFPYRTYPHVDQALRAQDAASALSVLMDEASKDEGTGRLTRSVLARPPMLDAADHGRTDPPGPMTELLEQAAAIGHQPGILSAGLTIGFPWADVPEAGPVAVVSALRSCPVDVRKAALDLARGLWQSREYTQLQFPDASAAMAMALRPSADPRPLILADFGDNPAAGAYGDSPNLLRAMIGAGLEDAAFASLADPASVQQAWDAGPGAVLNFRLGGRHTPNMTPPLETEGQVLALHDGEIVCEGPFLHGLKIAMGPIALLEICGIHVIVASRALAVTDPGLFHAVGIQPANLQTIGLKSRNHLRAAFGAMAREIILVDAGGIATMRLSQIPYRYAKRSVWPFTHSSHSNPDLERIHVFDTRTDARGVYRITEKI